MNIPSAENIYTTKYADFKGVDFTSQVCSRQRTPKGKNFIISDMVEKRPGWKVLKEFQGEKINGLYFTTINSIEYYLIHVGSKLYYMKSFDNEPVFLLNNINNAKSKGFCANEYYYILTGEEIIQFDGEKCLCINDEFYNEPFSMTLNTVYLLNSDYTVAETYTDIISQNKFTINGTTYVIDNNNIIADGNSYEIMTVYVNGKMLKNVVDIEGVIYRLSCTVTFYLNGYSTTYDYYESIMMTNEKEQYPATISSQMLDMIETTYEGNSYFRSNSNIPESGWNEDTIYSTIENQAKAQNLLCGYNAIQYNSFYYASNGASGIYAGYLLPPDAADEALCAVVFSDGTVKVSHAERIRISNLANAAAGAAGYINIVHIPNYRDYQGQPFTIIYKTKLANNKIYKSTESSYIQYGNGVYYFFTGNKEFPNRDWQSKLNNPLFIPSDKYTIYGNEDEVLGYGQYGEYLAVFKKGNIDTNIYVRSVTDLGDLGIAFPTSIGVGGAVGGLSSHTIFNMDGETLYLTNQGIFALTSLSLTNMRVTRNRSYFLDGLLLKEKNLEKAIACTWKQKYFLCVNSKCYILDGTQSKKYIDSTNNEYSYECLYWDNIPATSFLSTKDKLYFGTDDGKICVFTEEYYDGEEPTEMVFSTVLDDDGDFMSLKKMKKKGTGILVKPYTKSCFDISFIYDTYAETSVKTAYADIFNFDDVNFDRFTFETSENPRIIPFLKKSKKYKSIQIILKSSKPEPFGILEIVKRFTFNNYVKRS